MKYNFNIELTDKCNAACPFCDRTLWPENLEQAELTISDISKFFNGIKVSSVLFNGLYGDPVFCKDLIPIVEYFNFNKTSIEIATNGSKKGIWKDLAKNNVYVTFGIDGVTQETHSKHRVGTNLNTILNNAQEFIDAGGRAVWQFIPFKHNEHAIFEANIKANGMGFEKFISRSSRRYNEECEQPGEITERRKNYKGNTIRCKYMADNRYQIMATGRLHRCCYLPYTEDYPYSKDNSLNIKTHTFEQILKHQMWNEIGSWKMCRKHCSV